MAEVTLTPTIWEVSDDLLERAENLINECDPPKPIGRKRENIRKILNGIIFRFRSGCQWNHIPKQYGDDSTIHRTFQRWMQTFFSTQARMKLKHGPAYPMRK